MCESVSVPPSTTVREAVLIANVGVPSITGAGARSTVARLRPALMVHREQSATTSASSVGGGVDSTTAAYTIPPGPEAAIPSGGASPLTGFARLAHCGGSAVDALPMPQYPCGDR